MENNNLINLYTAKQLIEKERKRKIFYAETEKALIFTFILFCIFLASIPLLIGIFFMTSLLIIINNYSPAGLFMSLLLDAVILFFFYAMSIAVLSSVYPNPKDIILIDEIRKTNERRVEKHKQKNDKSKSNTNKHTNKRKTKRT